MHTTQVYRDLCNSKTLMSVSGIIAGLVPRTHFVLYTLLYRIHKAILSMNYDA